MSNPITVELPADLPTNWQQYQVVSPNGTEAGLDEQHGYNYLMEQVNNAQTAAKECGEALGDTVPASREINGHPLTDDVTLTGADINVSGTDSTSISTALSNKADVGAPQSYTLPLSTGWSAPSGARYQRTQDNMVVVTTGGIQLDSGASVSDGAQIATLPTGYRPRDYILVPAVIQDGGTRHAAAVQITISGAIIYNGPSNTKHPFRIFINSSYFVN